ncbi:hypothetical protein [Bradyrhizobium iriomotense]|uniref:Uncharacterized protein n=1 Tax=Bradyrhizobium iriomotense TaxID=441950 RepID=A0ABQ6AX12_9BRAD|nr:hypothetical protein [Bradyrhizobium iriomotense]GLR86540.1 hypothetical protein GCM10007857_32510 [Bradyrhizobium iriomotense]
MRILAEADFVDPEGQLVPRSSTPGRLLLVIAHSNVDGTPPADGESGKDEIHEFFRLMIAAAEEFPEFEPCLLNYDDAPSAVHRLGVERYGSSDFAEAMIYSALGRIQHITFDGETPESVRLWLRGTSLGLGLRATARHDDLIARLAYELAEPHGYSFSDARWDVPTFRSKVYQAARTALEELTEFWTGQASS